MSFTQEFEKTAGMEDVVRPIKYLGKAVYGLGKGVAKGVGYHAKRSKEKFTKELPEILKEWKGIKDPKSTAMLTRAATTFAPELAVTGLGAYGFKKATDPKERKETTPMAYYG